MDKKVEYLNTVVKREANLGIPRYFKLVQTENSTPNIFSYVERTEPLSFEELKDPNSEWLPLSNSKIGGRKGAMLNQITFNCLLLKNLNVIKFSVTKSNFLRVNIKGGTEYVGRRSILAGLIRFLSKKYSWINKESLDYNVYGIITLFSQMEGISFNKKYS